MYRYFVSFYVKGGFGNSVMTLDRKIKTADILGEVEKRLQKEANDKQLIIINFQQLK